MPTNLLRSALTANAAFSALSGVALTLGASPLSDLLGVPTWSALIVGVGLLPFAAAVAVISRDPQPQAVPMVIVADLVWVITAALLIIGFPGLMSTAGLWSLGIATIVVADLMIGQAVGLRRMEQPDPNRRAADSRSL
jgi:hypothetical protein